MASQPDIIIESATKSDITTPIDKDYFAKGSIMMTGSDFGGKGTTTPSAMASTTTKH